MRSTTSPMWTVGVAVVWLLTWGLALTVLVAAHPPAPTPIGRQVASSEVRP